jgi:hypothetical protein
MESLSGDGRSVLPATLVRAAEARAGDLIDLAIRPGNRVMAKKRPARRQAAPAQVGVEPPPPSAMFENCLTIALLAIYLGFLTHPIDLTDSDLGRYLKNGELFFQSGSIPRTNLFAYTTPDHPFVNHSWGSGVIYFIIDRALGFSGLSLFFIAVSGATLWLFLHMAKRYGNFASAVLLTLIVMPVLITRYEIRPEMFSYLLGGCFLHLLWDFREGRRGRGGLYLLPLLQLLWVNLHIYFFIGILMVGAFLLDSLIGLGDKSSRRNALRGSQWKTLLAVLLANLAASCVNPAGVNGAVYPLFIFQGYEFPVIENYSVPGILNAGFQFLPLTFFLIIFGVHWLSWLHVFINDRPSFSTSRFLLALFFSALAWWTIRNMAMFAFFALPLTAANLANAWRGRSLRWFASSPGIAAAAAAAALLLVLINPRYFFCGGRGAFGIGLEEGNLAALEFLRSERLRGPVFNNFDVGGYLIYGLYPRERVYVDNRPEAYPAAFFAEQYFSLLVNEEQWRKTMAVHGFNAIVINTRGRSAAAENFVIQRMLDADWAPVFFGNGILVLARRFGVNQPVVAKHELPREAVLQKSD